MYIYIYILYNLYIFIDSLFAVDNPIGKMTHHRQKIGRQSQHRVTLILFDGENDDEATNHAGCPIIFRPFQHDQHPKPSPSRPR